ncbi:MAG TPA: HupE/UreJ family protein [Polyangiaceae bacterium]|nr:HupE/UreJ family protein [Polyangiaceae bacterium]
MRWLPLLVAIVVVAMTSTAQAHPLAPVVLQLGEEGDAVVATLKEPAVRPRGAIYTPVWPCEPLADPERQATDEARLTRYRLRCDALVGSAVGVTGLGGVTAVVRVELPSGRVHQALVDADHPTITIPPASPAGEVVADYALLGMRHLLAGLDHVLFVVGLMLLVRGRRRLVVALTAFTLGHSITLGAAVLGLARLPAGPIELGIALSLVLLALQIARPRNEDRTPRRPWLFALTFGLLHGFGFAGGLTEAGLLAHDVPLALLGFNLGVELGQLAVVLAAWLLAALAGRLPLCAHKRSPAWLRLAPSYLIGSLAVMWCFERAAAWLG